MTCNEAEILLHALLDGELDAGHARDAEAHTAACPRCAAELREYRVMHAAMSSGELRNVAPASLRARVNAMVPAAAASRPPYRRTLFQGFALGSMLSAAAAASLVITVIRSDQDQMITGELVSAHLRSLQAEHLTDVLTSDQHTVKPWFNGRLDVAPPVVDLIAQGFTLVGGRLDYIDGRPVAAIVYRRSKHVINLFVAQGSSFGHGTRFKTIQGFNVKLWSEQGLNFWAVSDINADELQEFEDKFEAATRPGAGA